MTLLGAVGGTIAVLGAIVLPITSGDTAFRAARTIIADYLKIDQQNISETFNDRSSFICDICIVNTNGLQHIVEILFLGKPGDCGYRIMDSDDVFIYQRSNYFVS